MIPRDISPLVPPDMQASPSPLFSPLFWPSEGSYRCASLRCAPDDLALLRFAAKGTSPAIVFGVTSVLLFVLITGLYFEARFTACMA